MAQVKLSKWDIVDYLDDPAMRTEYLNMVLEHGDEDEILRALGHIARSIGMTNLAKSTGLTRASLYKTLTVGKHPRFSSVLKVIRAFGGKMEVAK